MKPAITRRVWRVSRTQHLKRFIYQRLLLRLRREIKDKNYPKMAALIHDEIGDWIIICGRYEDDLLGALIENVIPKILPDHTETTALDVGANIGNHTLAFSRAFASILAFEPNPIALHILRANVAMNACEHVEIFPFGLDISDGKKQYVQTSGNLGASKFCSTPGDGTTPIDLEVRNGDVVIETKGIRRVGLVKIDVEGMEPAVIQGLSRTLKEHCPIVLFEALDDRACKHSIKLLRSLGYNGFFSIERRRSKSKRAPSRWLERAQFGADLFLTDMHEDWNGDHSLVMATRNSDWLRVP